MLLYQNCSSWKSCGKDLFLIQSYHGRKFYTNQRFIYSGNYTNLQRSYSTLHTRPSTKRYHRDFMAVTYLSDLADFSRSGWPYNQVRWPNAVVWFVLSVLVSDCLRSGDVFGANNRRELIRNCLFYLLIFCKIFEEAACKLRYGDPLCPQMMSLWGCVHFKGFISSCKVDCNSLRWNDVKETPESSRAFVHFASSLVQIFIKFFFWVAEWSSPCCVFCVLHWLNSRLVWPCRQYKYWSADSQKNICLKLLNLLRIINSWSPNPTASSLTL